VPRGVRVRRDEHAAENLRAVRLGASYPISTERGTRRVQLVREGGGGGRLGAAEEVALERGADRVAPAHLEHLPLQHFALEAAREHQVATARVTLVLARPARAQRRDRVVVPLVERVLPVPEAPNPQRPVVVACEDLPRRAVESLKWILPSAKRLRRAARSAPTPCPDARLPPLPPERQSRARRARRVRRARASGGAAPRASAGSRRTRSSPSPAAPPSRCCAPPVPGQPLASLQGAEHSHTRKPSPAAPRLL